MSDLFDLKMTKWKTRNIAPISTALPGDIPHARFITRSIRNRVLTQIFKGKKLLRRVKELVHGIILRGQIEQAVAVADTDRNSRI